MARKKGHAALVVGEEGLGPAEQGLEAEGLDLAEDDLLELRLLVPESLVRYTGSVACGGVVIPRRFDGGVP